VRPEIELDGRVASDRHVDAPGGDPLSAIIDARGVAGEEHATLAVVADERRGRAPLCVARRLVELRKLQVAILSSLRNASSVYEVLAAPVP